MLSDLTLPSTQVLILIVIALQVADGVTTVVGIRRGIASERNPVLAPLFKRLGVLPTMLAIKAALIALVWFAGPLAHPWALVALAAGYVWIVANNLRVLASKPGSAAP